MPVMCVSLFNPRQQVPCPMVRSRRYQDIWHVKAPLRRAASSRRVDRPLLCSKWPENSSLPTRGSLSLLPALCSSRNAPGRRCLFSVPERSHGPLPNPISLRLRIIASMEATQTVLCPDFLEGPSSLWVRFPFPFLALDVDTSEVLPLQSRAPFCARVMP